MLSYIAYLIGGAWNIFGIVNAIAGEPPSTYVLYYILGTLFLIYGSIERE